MITWARMLVWLVASLLMAACRAPEPAAPAVAGASPPSRPNIVLIVADDLGYADVSAYHADRIPTPNIDRIGREGAVFAQGYVSAPICSPSRAAILTGRHQQRYGFEYNNGPPRRDIAERLGLDPREKTLADVLRDAGYRTGAVGKWHLGSAPEFYPMNRGFDEFWGFLTGQTNFIRPDAPDAVNALPPLATPQPGELVRPSRAVGPANAVITGAERRPVALGDGYLTEQITEQAIGFIERHRDRPFFLYVAHHAPHTPLQVTRRYYDRFPHLNDRAQRVYAGMVSALDDGVGALLDRLQALGLANNTIVVFLSDNGCAAYIPGLCSPRPVSGGKLTYLEGGVRVPFLMRWPARLAAGTAHTLPVSSLDLFPTLVSAAGARLPDDRAYDGTDLMRQVAGGPAAARGPLFWRTQPISAMRDGDWKYLRELDGTERLYRLTDDPREERDLAGAEAERLAVMRRRHEQWAGQLVAPRWPSRSVDFEFDGRRFRFTP